jgi:hypothetical protein
MAVIAAASFLFASLWYLLIDDRRREAVNLHFVRHIYLPQIELSTPNLRFLLLFSRQEIHHAPTPIGAPTHTITISLAHQPWHPINPTQP